MIATAKQLAELERRVKRGEEERAALRALVEAYGSAGRKHLRLFNAMVASLDALGLLTRSALVSEAVDRAAADVDAAPNGSSDR